MKIATRTRCHAGPSPSVEQVLLASSNSAGLVALESLSGDASRGRYSIVSSSPSVVVRCEHGRTPDPFTILDEWRGPAPDEPPGQIPFAGGWIGYLSYEAGAVRAGISPQAKRDLGLPIAWLALYDSAVVLDHHESRWWITAIELPQFAPQPPCWFEKRLDRWESLLGSAAAIEIPPVQRAADVSWQNKSQSARYQRRVARALEYIRAGDIYQANLSERFEFHNFQDSMDLYRILRQENPADYMAYLNCGDHQVLCSSPELFLWSDGRDVISRPIKGTSPRASDPVVDDLRAEALLNSSKDQAELAMIVDLERNDLARVCDRVTTCWPPQLETYRTVHHLVGEVRGRLARTPDTTAVSPARPMHSRLKQQATAASHGPGAAALLRACFPSGSITGAPKLRAMQIIDELEDVARGPYCGSIGFAGLQGNLTLNVAIRTMVMKGDRVYVHAGSGIVADSDPQSEYEEVLAKAQGMLRSLGISAGHG